MKDRAPLPRASPESDQFRPRSEEARILTALERKRRLLDLEITQFKALKDDEYTAYEGKLRSSLVEHPDELEGSPSSHSPVMLNGVDGNAESLNRRVDGASEGELVEDLLESEDDRLIELDVGRIDGGKVGIPETQSHRLDWSKKFPAFDRDFGPRDYFAPTYLPLLEKPRRVSINSPTAYPSAQLTLSSHGYRTKSHLSSSATLPSTPFDPLRSPPRTGPFSSSVPRPNALQGRGSTSRSDLSITSLRSSLKRPQTPRSSKHVLFAIDDHVLSPSTSPVARRKESAHPPIPFAGLTDLPKQTRQSSGLNKNDEPSPQNVDFSLVEQIEDIRTTSPSSENAHPAATVASPSSIVSYHQLLEPTNIKSRTTRDDFENVRRDDDALFSFDEDVDEHDLVEIEVDNVSIQQTGI